MARGDLTAMPDREPGHMPFGLGVPQRLVGLTKAGKQKVEWLAVVIDNPVPSHPRVESFARMTNTGVQPASVVVDPETISGQMLTRNCRDLDQPADKTAWRTDAAVAHAHALVLGSTGASLQVAQLDSASGWVGQAISSQRLQALGLQAGIERK